MSIAVGQVCIVSYYFRHYTSRACKTFRKSCVDHLVKEPVVKTIGLPGVCVCVCVCVVCVCVVSVCVFCLCVVCVCVLCLCVRIYTCICI